MSTTEGGIDLAAVSRVSRNVDLRDIRVIELAASCSPAPEGTLEPRITFEAESALVEVNQLNVKCDYSFTARSAGVLAATIKVVYLLTYEVLGDALEGRDVEQFSRVNGAYHSWPFLRQLLFDLTAKLGLPTLTLPVFQALPRAKDIGEDGEGLKAKREKASAKPRSAQRKIAQRS